MAASATAPILPVPRAPAAPVGASGDDELAVHQQLGDDPDEFPAVLRTERTCACSGATFFASSRLGPPLPIRLAPGRPGQPVQRVVPVGPGLRVEAGLGLPLSDSLGELPEARGGALGG